ncbi:unnamed protein product [Rhodiola kirilowii]
MTDKAMHVAMYPWFAMGHLTAFIHLANKLAERSINISFFIPTKTQSKIEHFNRHPDRITFVPIPVPQIKGLPPGAETTSDVPFPLHPLIMTAMDETRPFCEASFEKLKPDIVFFDFTHWLPYVTRKLGIKAIHFCCTSSVTIGYLLSPARVDPKESDLYDPPPGFTPTCIKLKKHEARGLFFMNNLEYGKGIKFMDRQMRSFMDCDAISFKAIKEIEGPYLDYVEKVFKRPVFPAGPIVPEQSTSTDLDTKWVDWLSQFQSKSVIYCAFGSECVLKLEQFQELLLGYELTGRPFLVALKPPIGADSVESALPEEFQERVKDRGIVYGGWVQQQLILAHPSIGCFVTHCGSGSLSEALMNECQLVLFPQVGDQIINARMMGLDLRVGVEVEKNGEDGSFTRDGVCKAVNDVMDKESDIGKEVRANHAKWKEFLNGEGIDKNDVAAPALLIRLSYEALLKSQLHRHLDSSRVCKSPEFAMTKPRNPSSTSSSSSDSSTGRKVEVPIISKEGNGGANFSGHRTTRYPNPPDALNPDAATLREQWRYAIRLYSKWYSHAWGTAILAGVSFFALGWIIKGENPIHTLKGPSSKEDNLSKHSVSDPDR